MKIQRKSIYPNLLILIVADAFWWPFPFWGPMIGTDNGSSMLKAQSKIADLISFRYYPKKDITETSHLP